LLTEGLLVALAGGAAGLLLAGLGADAISSIQIPADPPVLLPVRLDLRVLLFTLAVSVVSSVLFGLAPALYTTRTDLAVALKQGEAAAAGRRRLPGRHLLVAGQVAVSLVLLHAAFSYLHQFHAALASGPGFRTDHLLMMSFDPSLSGGTADRAGRFYRDLEQQAGTSAGVHRAALASVVPLGLSSDVRGIVPEGFQLPAGRDRITVGAATVTTAYFEVAGIPIVAGRGFCDTDQEGAPRVAIVNQTTARRFWPDGAAVGRRIRLKGPAEDWVEVVGIARDSKYYWIGESPTRFLYLPHAQNPSPRMTLLVQTASGAEQMAAPLRELAHRLDPDMPAFDVRTMENFFDKRAVRIPSVIIGLVGSLGLLGLVLALAGLYGLVSYLVSRQTREIGIRMALGAASAGVLVRFLRRGLLLAGAGVAVGVALSAAVHPILRASFGLGPLNLPALVLLPLALLAVTALATLAPAWRASRIVPTRALRYE
jgi:predicted permease